MTAMSTTTTVTAKDSFDRFGDDLCQLLLTYLPIDNRLRLQSVSKQWLALIFNTETHLIFDKILFMRLSINLLNTDIINNSRDMYTSVDPMKLFELIVKKCPNITSVNISGVCFADNYRYLELLIKYCQRLTHISLKPRKRVRWVDNTGAGNDTFDRFCSRFGQQLIEFKFDGKHVESNEQLFYKCLDCLTTLKTVDISRNRRTILGLDVLFAGNKSYSLPKTMQSLALRVDQIFIPLFTKFTDSYGQQIRSLNLLVDKLEDQNNFKTLSTGLSQMQQLRQLSISLAEDFSTEQTVQLMTTIGRQCRQLKEFRYKSKVSTVVTIDRMFAAINELMSPHLRRLSVNCWPDWDEEYSDLLLTSSSLNRLYRLTHLTLRLHYWCVIRHRFFQDIHRNLPRLQSLYCDRASITEETITVFKQLSHLSDVYLRCDPNTLTTTESFIRHHLLIIGTNIQHLYIEYRSIKFPQMIICGKYLNTDYDYGYNGDSDGNSSDSDIDSDDLDFIANVNNNNGLNANNNLNVITISSDDE